MKGSTMVSTALQNYLRSWFETSTQNQRSKGVAVTLTFKQFVGLFTKRQLASLQSSIDARRIHRTQAEDNRYAYVLTWKSYAARSTNVLSEDTAQVCSRTKSAAISLPAKGDQLRPSHREAIAAAKAGVAQTEDHRRAISDSLKGKPKVAWTEERKAARRRQIAERNGGS